MKRNQARRGTKMKKTEQTSLAKSQKHGRSAFAEAYLLSRKASRAGFDWPDIAGVVEKLEEELAEFKGALSMEDRKKAKEELGDLFFVMVNAARFLSVHPEKALQGTIRKFKSRFRYVEETLRKKGKTLRQSSLAEMEELWQQAKQRRRRGPHWE